MRRLGELLLERGALAAPELHTALEACRREGGRLGTHLLRLGFIDERVLLEALSVQLGVPFVPEAVLTRAPEALRRSFPPGLLQRLQAVPFAQENGRLRVAMTNPNDAAAQDEMASFTRLTIEPYVATEEAVRLALGDPGLEVFERPRPGGDAGVRSRPVSELWHGLWQVPRVDAEELLRLSLRRPAKKLRTLKSTFPGLVPLDGQEGPREEPELDDRTFLHHLQEARHRDDIARALLQFASRYLGRVCLFAAHRNRASGWMAAGRGPVLEDVQTLTVPLDEPSVFSSLAGSRTSYVGVLPHGELNGQISEVLGEPVPAEVLVVPVRVKDRAVSFLVGDNPGERGVNVPVAEIVLAAARAGIAFEILILKNKIVS